MLQGTLALPTPVIVVGLVLAGLAATVLPTYLYLYVEPRGRPSWAKAGDTPETRRAPAVVRLAAWMSFVVGQLAIPWALVPMACAVLLYLQAKLGVARPAGFFVTVSVLSLALLQIAQAFRLIPLGVKLLARDRRVAETAPAVARHNAMFSASVLAGAMSLTWAMTGAPRLVHPWLRIALERSALWPLAAYAALCLLHAAVLRLSARALRDPGDSGIRG